jgi:hypothetical protein
VQYVEEPPSKPHRQKPHRPTQFGATPEPIVGRQHMDVQVTILQISAMSLILI